MTSTATPDPTLTSAQWTDWSTGVRLVVTRPEALAIAEQELCSLMHRVELAASRFRPGAEISRLGARAGQPVPVSDLLWTLIDVALDVAAATEGLVDPTIAPALDELGYDRTFPAVRQRDEQVVVRTRPVVGWQSVERDPDRRTVTVPAGCALDLGATAKAWTADTAAHSIAAATGAGVLVSLGGDIAVAGPPPASGWPVRVADDHASERPSDPVIVIRDGGLATSSTTTRAWGQDGRLHHIVEPATGRPTAGPWRTVSVAAGSCVDANAASTAAIVRGRGADAWLSGLGLAARLVRQDGMVTTVGGWPEGPGR